MDLPGRTERKAKEEIHGCSEGRHAGSWSQRRRCREQGKMETNDSLWQPLKRHKPKGEKVPVFGALVECSSLVFCSSSCF